MIAATVTIPICSKRWGEISMVLKIEKTRQGALMVITRELTNSVSKIRPSFDQLHPIRQP